MGSLLYSTWHENLVVHVVDESNRPIQYANVTIHFQKQDFPITSDDELDGVVSKLTDKNGKASFSFGNYVDNPMYELRYYIVDVNYVGLHKNEKVLCSSFSENCHDKTNLLKYDLRTKMLKVKVQDQDGLAISGAKVYYDSFDWTTPSSGEVSIAIPMLSSYTVLVEYGGKKRTLEDRMGNEDVEQKVQFQRYNIKLHVIDDEGNPLSSEVMIGDQVQNTDENGYVLFENVVDSVVNVMVRFEGGFKEISLPVSSSSTIDLVVDNTPPKIEHVNWDADEEKKAVVVSASLYDPGARATGLDQTRPAELRYNVEGEGWRVAQMYPAGKGVYKASIPLLYNKHIAFEIVAYDDQGNSASYSNELYIEGTEDVSSGSNENANDGGNEESASNGGNNLWLYVVIGLLIALIAYKKYTGEF